LTTSRALDRDFFPTESARSLCPCPPYFEPPRRCRRNELFSPFACEHEKHEYEICMYKEYERRRQIKKEG